ncbi:MAG: hypothetical protein LBC86_01595, partial [Oscillospiraceae bacterium]|nr:hypothetical protein [Oscillospiraceae bacterium]
QLDEDGVKWSAKLEDNGKTTIAVNSKDADGLVAAVDKAKPQQAEAPIASDVPLPEAPAPKRK